MKKSLRNKIINAYGLYDTKKYRYIIDVAKSYKAGKYVFARCPIANLDTTAALGEWEEVK